jgi:hypothetical protein
MRKNPFAETVLALFAGRERGTAIYGDLAELGTGRGRVWFAAAYLRTLVALRGALLSRLEQERPSMQS